MFWYKKNKNKIEQKSERGSVDFWILAFASERHTMKSS